jgi:hypothetical protein
MSHVERKTELKRRRKRHDKLRKLKAKLAKAKNPHETQVIMQKIKVVSPFWRPPGQPQPAQAPLTKGHK